jgi:hypothetical protein
VLRRLAMAAACRLKVSAIFSWICLEKGIQLEHLEIILILEEVQMKGTPKSTLPNTAFSSDSESKHQGFSNFILNEHPRAKLTNISISSLSSSRM